MNENSKTPPPPDLSLYHQNRQVFPREELLQYAGRYVAFSPDGTHILASGMDMEEVGRTLVAAGIHPSQVVGSYIPALDEALI